MTRPHAGMGYGIVWPRSGIEHGSRARQDVPLLGSRLEKPGQRALRRGMLLRTFSDLPHIVFHAHLRLPPRTAHAICGRDFSDWHELHAATAN